MVRALLLGLQLFITTVVIYLSMMFYEMNIDPEGKYGERIAVMLTSVLTVATMNLFALSRIQNNYLAKHQKLQTTLNKLIDDEELFILRDGKPHKVSRLSLDRESTKKE